MTLPISVVIPTYNHAHFLGRALQSVLDQTYTNWEAIVIDNHSEDATDEVVCGFADSRIKYLKIHNNGVIAASRNMGIRASIGKWIAFLDSDDWWSPNKLQVCLNRMTDKIDLLYHDLKIIREISCIFKSKIIKTSQVKEPVLIDLLVNGSAISNSSVVVRKSLLDQIGGIDETPEMIGAEDYNAWLRIAEISDAFCYIPQSLGYYMLHDKGVSRKDMSIPGRCAITPFMHLLNEKQQRGPESSLKYTKGRYAFVSRNYTAAIENLLYSVQHGKPIVKLKSAWMFIGMLIEKLIGPKR